MTGTESSPSSVAHTLVATRTTRVPWVSSTGCVLSAMRVPRAPSQTSLEMHAWLAEVPHSTRPTRPEMGSGWKSVGRAPRRRGMGEP
jgi:hypothetical protein